MKKRVRRSQCTKRPAEVKLRIKGCQIRTPHCRSSLRDLSNPVLIVSHPTGAHNLAQRSSLYSFSSSSTMSTIPSRLARAAQTSVNHAEARARVFKLYRDWYRGTPEIIAVYTLNVSPAFFRHAIRQQFEENRYVTDLKTIDILLQKSRLEFQETINCWKTTDHVLGVLLKPRGRPQRSFLEKFYEGRDEDQVLPAATGIVHPHAI